ncbi:hypothetical protein ACFQT0_09110 [Hymenobacter humi]|uniref:Uncharacterized protein n=1 Tax=Hymenobacter humi TaxID=1411620 RepID=A0ABW2U3R9_9BACT
MDFTARASGPELMDDLTLATDALRQNLNELETINTWLGAMRPCSTPWPGCAPGFPAAAPCAWPTWAAAAATPCAT